MANSAQWVAWGIVQAKVEGMEEALNARPAVAEGICELDGPGPLSDEARDMAEDVKVEVVRDEVHADVHVHVRAPVAAAPCTARLDAVQFLLVPSADAISNLAHHVPVVQH